jgi:hypothetical protein
MADPVQPLADVRGADAVCSEYRRPEGVTLSFQVCTYSIDPPPMEVERLRLSESFSEFVGSGEVTPANRDSESSLKLSSDNFCGCDLLPEYRFRTAALDEPEELGPEVPLVFFTRSLSGRTERLTRAGTGPDGAVVGPTGESEGVGPSENSAEEVALNKSSKVSCVHLLDWPLIHFSIRHQAGLD